MAALWLIRLPADSDGRVAWTNPGDGERVCRHDLLSNVAAMAGKRVAVVVPGGDVLLTFVSPPRAAKRDLIKAVPFLLEEALSAPVETLHFAFGVRRADGLLPVAVVARRLMEEWLSVLRGAGLEPAMLVPEPLLLPWVAEEWCLVSAGGMVMARTGVDTGFAVDLETLATVLGLALTDPHVSRPARIRVLDYAGSADVPDLVDIGVPVKWERAQGDPLSLMSAQAYPGIGINLLQDEFAPVGKWSGTLRAFRWTAVLLMIWMLVKGGVVVMEAWRMEQRSAELDQKIVMVFKETFPDVRRIVNPRVQMTQQLDGLRGQTGRQGGGEKGFLTLLGRAGGAMKETPEAVLHGLRFQEGKLELLLRLSDLQRLDALKQRMEAKGVTVSIQSAVREGDAISARLKVEQP
ncbi:MAG: type II secretion system protein GspL [Magnetococcus sp. YQC-5]